MRRMSRSALFIALLFVIFVGNSCRRLRPDTGAAIEFTKVPIGADGGTERFETIEGRVTGAKPGQRIVLYSKSGIWWVQPFAVNPFTNIQADSKWRASVHLGHSYAALLVDPSFVPKAKLESLPARGGSIAAVASVKGRGLDPVPVTPITIHFSGYDWEVRQLPSPRGGVMNPYDPANARVDERGFLHLRVTPLGDKWDCSEVRLKTSLGPGLYLFTAHDVSNLEPAAVLTFYTWDEAAVELNHREIDIEISRWGDPDNKNGQYVIQPFYEPSNVVRFEAQPGTLTYSFRWEPRAVSFKTVRGNTFSGNSRIVSEHAFTAGVPPPGGESVQIGLYAYGNAHHPMQRGAEVIIEKFEFLP